MEINALCEKLYNIGSIKFGNYTLKSGIQSPFYIDLRCTISSSELLGTMSTMLLDMLPVECKESVKCICGVPYTALPFASVISLKSGIGMVLRRKEKKEYGSKQQVDGVYEAGWTCLLVEDVITSGASVLETVQDLESVGIKVTDALVIMDREQGGAQRLRDAGIRLHCLLSISQVTKVLRDSGQLSDSTVSEVSQFISDNQFSTDSLKSAVTPTPVKNGKQQGKRALSDVMKSSSNKMTQRLLQIVARKQSNLVLSADVTTAEELLIISEQCGAYICAVKTHADIIFDFTAAVGRRLKELADKYDFLIIEDRKFCEIGSIARQQYRDIVSWAHLVTVVGLPGPDLILAIKQVSEEAGEEVRGCLIVAEMSSRGQLADHRYSQACEAIAEQHSDFVIGFIAQNYTPANANFIVMSPGVSLASRWDRLGQQYRSPRQALTEGSTDIVIVGRGIVQSERPDEAAREYQREGWAAAAAAATSTADTQ